MRAAGLLGPRPEASLASSEEDNIKAIHDALYAAKIISYAQGFMLMREAASEQGWALDYGAIALMWRGGCIIRSKFLGNIREAYENNPQLENLAQDGFFTDALKAAEADWRKAVILAVENGIPIPAIASPFHTTMVTAASACPPTCCRRSVTILERIPMKGWTSRGVNSFTPTGRDMAARSHRQPMKCEW